MFPLDRWPSGSPVPGRDRDEAIVAYCAEEVRRQADTPWHVWRMYDAWRFAQEQQDELDRRVKVPLTHALVREIGKRIDEENYVGYRRHNVWVGGRQGTHPLAIMPEMSALLDSQGTLTPDIFYYQFEIIHPFADGNGRTGKVLFNWLNGTLDDPVWPPDFFGGITNP